jgi:glycerate 2-kinase
LSHRRLRDEAVSIWQAGVDAVKPARLLQEKVCVKDSLLIVDGIEYDLSSTGRIIVVGAGKASADMAIAFEQQVFTLLKNSLSHLELDGWINCPEGSFDPAHAGQRIKLFAARPAGKNEPTPKAVQGTQRILDLVASCSPTDLVVCLLSGGGSALLTAPAPGITLEDKQAVARLVAAAGGNIVQLNAIRRALSRVKAGGLARACKSAQLLTLVISDVLGDSLETIASGPTYVDAPACPEAALQALEELLLTGHQQLESVVRLLKTRSLQTQAPVTCNVQHVILGNNGDAVFHARARAEELGYRCRWESASSAEGDVMLVADAIAESISPLIVAGSDFNCWIGGGEPTVELPAQPGKGGRNQQLALAVLKRLNTMGWPAEQAADLAFVSGGTDGEDGPTDAAGAWFDRQLAVCAREFGLDADKFLIEADAYRFFEAIGGLLQVGPTGTNVCDLRVAIAD